MKDIVKKIEFGLILGAIFWSVSCDLVTDNLKENPKDFRATNNAYVTRADYQKAIVDLYARTRSIYFGESGMPHYSNLANMFGTDIGFNAREDERWFGSYNIQLQPENGWVERSWNKWYKIIANANTILSHLNESELNENEETVVAAKAKFFRAFSYRHLVYLYGGIPLILEEIKGPETDFTRSPKEEVLNQIIEDAYEAASNLPSIDQVEDGRVSNLVAQQLLAETYISLGSFDKAIEAATIVIDDPSTSLMTGRFGSRANEDPEDELLNFETPGDVYWDLFRRGNQNRSVGNTEALWVAQMETDEVGGLLSTGNRPGNQLERAVGPLAWILLDDPDGNAGMISQPLSDYNTGGRGVSNLKPTDYVINDIWESDWDNDIRNAPHNFVRDVIYNNPESNYYGESALEYPSPTLDNQEWRWYPHPSKVTTPGNHPDAVYDNRERNILSGTAGSTYRDRYYMRLAETYLLRAEAYLSQGDKVNAADDINTLRERSNASSVGPDEITIDYILDERARELLFEEQRRITLVRTKKLIERVREYNPLNGPQIEDYHNLWPIPTAEIEANTDADLEQNPGYN